MTTTEDLQRIILGKMQADAESSPSNPHDILRVLGEKELQKYLVNEIQPTRFPHRGTAIAATPR
jgi:hypothetical protein